MGTASRVDQPCPQTAPPLCSALQNPRRPQTQMGPQHVLNPEPKGCGLLPLPIPGRGPLVGRVQAPWPSIKVRPPGAKSPFPGLQHMD